MELRNTITIARKIRIFVKRKAQNTVVLSFEVKDGMVKATLKQLGKRFNSFYIDLYLNTTLIRPGCGFCCGFCYGFCTFLQSKLRAPNLVTFHKIYLGTIWHSKSSLSIKFDVAMATTF